MNLYIRYFDDEVVVTTVEEALDFIRTIEGFTITPQFEQDFREYADGAMPYPKRYKVRSRVYFIVIKTQAASLTEFKANGKQVKQVDANGELLEGTEGAEGAADVIEMAPDRRMLRPKDQILMQLNAEQPGWYEGTVIFKRVIYVPDTGKHDYEDSVFTARVKAMSAQDCYNRIVDYLQSRVDIDRRSQFPSPKGKNFSYTYLGLKPFAEVNV